MHADGTVIPSPFTIVAENGRKVTCFLTEGARIIYPQNHTHSLDHDILLVLLGSADWILVVEVNPHIMHLLWKRGLFVQHVCNECRLIVPRAGRRILWETRIQLERLRQIAT